MGGTIFGSFICRYSLGMNSLCMVASITNITTMAFETVGMTRAKKIRISRSKYHNLSLTIWAFSLIITLPIFILADLVRKNNKYYSPVQFQILNFGGKFESLIWAGNSKFKFERETRNSSLGHKLRAGNLKLEFGREIRNSNLGGKFEIGIWAENLK